MEKVLFILIGVIALSFSAWRTHCTLHNSEHMVTSQGVVIQVVSLHHEYSPVVKFPVDHSGTNATFTSDSSANPPKYQVGDTVNVVYPSHHPEHAYISSWFDRWAFALFSGMVGILFIIIGLISIWYSRYLRTRNRIDF